jgi:hypothetical protein
VVGSEKLIEFLVIAGSLRNSFRVGVDVVPLGVEHWQEMNREKSRHSYQTPNTRD